MKVRFWGCLLAGTVSVLAGCSGAEKEAAVYQSSRGGPAANAKSAAPAMAKAMRPEAAASGGGGFAPAAGAPDTRVAANSMRLSTPGSPPADWTRMDGHASNAAARFRLITGDSEAKAVQRSPNLYLSNGYLGGEGERDRIEKLISNGVMVNGKCVKLEAFTRNYGQAFPIPTREALAVTAETERSKIVEQGDRTYLQIGLQAMKGELPRRPPLHIALVIDCSGSMEAEGKMQAAVAAARRLVEAMTPADTIAVIRFADEARVLVPSAPVRNKAGVLRAVDGLTPGGGTNIYAGLQLGFNEASRFASPDAVNRVILLSDGEVTAGVNDRSRFEQLAAAYADRDIQTTAVGLGLEYNEDLMLAIAREGKGNYHFIKNSADTQTVFDSELNELTHVVAKAVKLRVVLAPGVGFVRALGAHTLDQHETLKAKSEEKKIDRHVAEELGIAQNRHPERDEPGIKLLIPSFYRGDNHVVMLEVAVPPGKGQGRIADVYLRYKDLVSRSNREARTACAVTYTPYRDQMVASVNRNVKKNLLGFQTGEALIAASEMMDRGNVAEAIHKVDERMAVLGVAAQQWHDRDLDRDGQLLNQYKSVLGQLGRDGTLASGEFGQYLKKSLTYAGYRMTR